MNATFKILRFDPERDAKPSYKEYVLEDLDPTYRILDALHDIKWKLDGSLTFRRACGHGMCGSDAMLINGKNSLACQVLLKDVDTEKPIVIEPLPYLPILKDLAVDMSAFFRKYEMLKPYVITDELPPTLERYQSPDDAELIMEATKCILCGCCTASCPSLWSNENYLGPAAFVQAYRFVFDSRDVAAEQHLDAVDSPDGIWRCHTIFNCVECCPKDINVTWHISQLKKRLVSSNL
ncbi:MAG: succinate dehydrogenase iron-sulfur subunit [Candidatus Kapaibacterium sp.]|jgi:succinate dehydrogenase / fumarate reductase iron-sulfur subunit